MGIGGRRQASGFRGPLDPLRLAGCAVHLGMLRLRFLPLLPFVFSMIFPCSLYWIRPTTTFTTFSDQLTYACVGLILDGVSHAHPVRSTVYPLPWLLFSSLTTMLPRRPRLTTCTSPLVRARTDDEVELATASRPEISRGALIRTSADLVMVPVTITDELQPSSHRT